MATPEELAQLLQYGRDTSQLGMRNTQAPGHWTQALAGALQMGIGGHYGAKGAYGMGQGKLDANKRLGELLAGGDPRAAAQGMLQDPWLGDEGRKLALREMDPMTGLERQKAQFDFSQAQKMAPLNEQLMRAKIAQSQRLAETGGATTPAAVATYKFWRDLPTDKDRENFMRTMRADKILDTGTGFAAVNPVNPGAPTTPVATKDIAGVKREEARGTFEGGEPKRVEGKQKLSGLLRGMTQNYLKLDEVGGIVNPDNNMLSNLRAKFKSSGIGQSIGGAVGAEEQSIRQRINASRPLMMQSIMQATGMSARALDSNRELDFYLQAVSDPNLDLLSNLAAIDALDRTFGLGNTLKSTLPPRVYQRVSQQAQTLMAQMPIKLAEPMDGQNTSAPDVGTSGADLGDGFRIQY